MKIINHIVLFTSLAFLGACASTPPLVTGTEGANTASESTSEVTMANSDGMSNGVSDSDGDSIPDVNDVCAGTPVRVMVDTQGCEIALGAIDGLNFGPGETALSASAEDSLDRYVAAMKRYPEVVVTLEGHTDNRGPAAANLELSKERVLSVVRYMVGNGISPDRIKPFGYGESRPRSANATASGREQNRRIEIKVLEGLL